MSSEKIIVNSWNEWDPLKHVIVGKADGCCIPAPEPALDAKVPEDSDMRGQYGPRTKDTVDKANELLDNFANMLKNGVEYLCDYTSDDHPFRFNTPKNNLIAVPYTVELNDIPAFLGHSGVGVSSEAFGDMSQHRDIDVPS